ncbi:MAG TPA: adenylate/guanylate cyclase domain-containing protein [Rectinemataceae bacterium]|nr:adenylate/guanylate cyclase domain-containing protein [Rectinemataceae bacterium]
MAKKRAKFLETRIFGFVIAAAIVAITIVATFATGLLQTMEYRVLDTRFQLKNFQKGRSLQEGSVFSEHNLKISDDIMIVGIDANTLNKYGRWPFPRSRHADLINAFSRIKDQSQRENALLMDIFFSDPTDQPADDDALEAAMKDSGRVFLETTLNPVANDSAQATDLADRESLLYQRFGTLQRITGPWQDMLAFPSSDPPLARFTEAAAGYGHATYLADRDRIFRRQPIVAKTSVVEEVLKLDELKPGYTVDSAAFERLAWMDKDQVFHNIPTPITQGGLDALRRVMTANAPKKIDTQGGDQSGFFVVRKFKDSFVPSITLSLALNYFGKSLSDVDVIIGNRVRIPSPTRYNPDSGEREPYTIQVSPDQYDKDGNLLKQGDRRPVPFIDIPIDANGQMLINFMGPASSASSDGIQTYPVRPYSGYADKAPPSDPTKWRRTIAAANKILMVGAFAQGMAADDKRTPFGIMYGIEVHANALNTILMDNFLVPVPLWIDLLILAALAFLVAFMTSRLSTVFSFFATLIIIVAFFLGTSMIFDNSAKLVNFSSPAIAMIFTFIAIVVYRAMTEERDKRMIRETFGKYLSPKVVDQLVDNPPELGGVDKELTVLFSDIRSFTTLSESMSPQELVNHLNVYLTAMTDVILDYGGYLDKYVGDEVMCFWGAPLPQADHAVRACKCALRQMQRLRELNESWPEAVRINIGIGLNSGIMTVGNMGSPARMNYTLMGDNVNLGARLEGTNKEYGTNVIISEFTYGLVKDKFVVRELDNIRVKGKNKPVLIYELVDCLEDLAPPSLVVAKGRG